MLKEHLKMPQFPTEGKPSGGIMAGSMFGAAIEPKKMPVGILFFEDFDGQAGGGALRVQ